MNNRTTGIAFSLLAGLLLLCSSVLTAQDRPERWNPPEPGHPDPPTLERSRQESLLKQALRAEKASESVPKLVRIVEWGTESEYRDRAKELLEQVPEQRAVRAMLDRLDHEIFHVRALLAKRLGEAARSIEKEKLRNRVTGGLLDRLVNDRWVDARNNALHAARKLNHRRTIVKKLEPVVNSRNEVQRVRAVEAMGKLGDPYAVPVVVKRYHRVYGGGPTAHVFFGRQEAYIQDVDAQVSTGSTAVDPDIGTVTQGMVLEANVKWIDEYITVVEWKTTRDALQNIVGAEIGHRPKQWQNWYRNNRSNLAAWIARTAPDRKSDG